MILYWVDCTDFNTKYAQVKLECVGVETGACTSECEESWGLVSNMLTDAPEVVDTCATTGQAAEIELYRDTYDEKCNHPARYGRFGQRKVRRKFLLNISEKLKLDLFV